MQDDAMPRAVGVAGADVSLPFTDTQRRALITLTTALALGIATQSLFWRARLGLNFLVWDLMLTGAVLAALRRGRPASSAWGAAAACVLFGVCVALRASAWTAVLAVPAAVVLLAALPLLVSEKMGLWELPGLPLRWLLRLDRVPRAASETVKFPFRIVGASQRTRVLRLAGGMLLGLTAASVFIALFSSDPEFEWVLHRAYLRADSAAWFGTWSLLTAAGYLFVHRLHREPAAVAPSPSTPPAAIDAPVRPSASGGGAAYRDWIAPPAEVPAVRAAQPLLSRETWATTLVPIIGVFALFVGLNLRHVFRGNTYVRYTSGASYSSYLHSGFYQLLVATILSVCLVRVGHALLRPRGAGAGAHVPGGAAIRALEVTLLALTVLTLFSCLERLWIYEEAYGATYLRLGVAVIALGVLGVLVLSIVQSIVRGWRSFGGATVLWLMGVVLATSAFNADGYIARRNLDRAATGRPLDVEYLYGLSADARVALKHPYLAAPANVGLRYELDRAWTSRGYRPRDWREHRGL